MVVNIVNFLSNAIVQKSTGTSVTKTSNSNPFDNPFISATYQSVPSYAKNNPVRGGYFAGYYNGKPNIVGQRLFIEA